MSPFPLLQYDYGLNLSGWSLYAATAISQDGRTISGYGTDPSGRTQAWVATIPEPATLLLIAAATLTTILRGGKGHTKVSG